MEKINLGCGSNRIDGWINVDKFEPADLVVDLENQHWPFNDNSVDEVLFYHSLEHMGETVAGFFHIMKELYRVCCNEAKITIVVPHPFSRDFINDPTHVRVITPAVLDLFSKENNDLWVKQSTPNSKLALQLKVDFKIINAVAMTDERLLGFPEYIIKDKIENELNAIKQYSIVMKAVK